MSDPNKNWTAVHQDLGDVLYLATADLDVIWSKNTTTGEVTLVTPATDIIIATADGSTFKQGISLGGGVTETIIQAGTDQQYVGKSSGIVGLSAVNSTNIGRASGPGAPAITNIFGSALVVTTDTNDGTGAIQLEAAGDVTATGVNVGLSTSDPGGLAYLSSTRTGGHGVTGVSVSTSNSDLKITTTTTGNLQIANTGTGTVSLAAGTGKVSIQGVSIEPTGGSTGSILAQNSGGTFVPQAAATLGLMSNTLTNTHIFVGNASAVATDVALSGDATLANTGALTLANTAVTAASYGSASAVGTFTVDGKGRLTAAATTAIAIAESQVTSLVSDLAAKAPLASPALTGTPTAPTQSRVTNNTDIATTAYADRIRLVCTSGTHPGSPSAGDEIYETDTGKTLVYQGSTDTWTPPWNTAWGFIASATTTTDQTNISTQVDVAGATVTFTAIANRHYKVSYFMTPFHGAGLGALIELGVYDGSNVLKGGDQLGAEVSANGAFFMAQGYVESPSAGSTTRKVRINASGTQGGIFGAAHPGTLLVEDIGPNGNPS